jgi:acetyl-CoA carboxylase biotin carboxylase subunit
VTPAFRKVLVANRGVCAMRILRTLARMGIASVAVHSEADAALPHVAAAGESLCIGGPAARDSYLRGEALIAAARETGADAIHPGYGFLAENAAFARAVEAAGLTFIGPRPDHIAAMGDKVSSRARMAGAGIPLLPASGALAPEADAAAIAAAIGYPLLVKATAGGGGIGMQKVMAPEALEGALRKARMLAERNFADGSVYLERWVEPARHVEFQMLGDGRGGVVSLFDRDCSVQRRHQKVIEETPAPFVDADAVAAMGERLRAALAGWSYASLGTVEMVMDGAGALHFLEMNTRLQVEHGVTEAVTGLDLVELQIRAAAGESIETLLPRPPRLFGHAVEARIYAEDPVRFLPSPGRLDRFRAVEAAGVSVDAGYRQGNSVTPHYDPMLAIVIAHGRDRTAAIAALDRALAQFEVGGVSTNIAFLRRMLASPDFARGAHHTTLAEAMARAPAGAPEGIGA